MKSYQVLAGVAKSPALRVAGGRRKEANSGWSSTRGLGEQPRVLTEQLEFALHQSLNSPLELLVNHGLWECNCVRTFLPQAHLPLSPLSLPPPQGCAQIAHIKKQIDYELSFVYQQFLICNLVMSERKSLIIQ